MLGRVILLIEDTIALKSSQSFCFWKPGTSIACKFLLGCYLVHVFGGLLLVHYLLDICSLFLFLWFVWLYATGCSLLHSQMQCTSCSCSIVWSRCLGRLDMFGAGAICITQRNKSWKYRRQMLAFSDFWDVQLCISFFWIMSLVLTEGWTLYLVRDGNIMCLVNPCSRLVDLLF